MTTQEGNKLIAEYEGYIPCEKPSILDYVGLEISIHALRYETDWEQLMPIVEKIEEAGYFVMINRWTSVYTGSDSERIMVTSIIGNAKIRNTWLAVVEFIKWHNDKQKPNYKAIVDQAIGEKPSLVKENIIKAVREQSRFVTLGVDGPVRIRTTRINNDKQDTK